MAIASASTLSEGSTFGFETTLPGGYVGGSAKRIALPSTTPASS
jgi:hypothetical protein